MRILRIYKMVLSLSIFWAALTSTLFWGMGQSRQSPSVQELLFLADQADDPDTFAFLAKALENQKPATSYETGLLIQALDHPHWDIQRAAATALGNSKAAEAVPKLIEKLETLSGLIRIPHTGATEVDLIQKALVAETIVSSLSLIGDERALEPLLNHPEFYKAHMGVKPLASFGAKALPFLLKKAGNQKDPDRQEVLGIVAGLRDPEAIPQLLDMARAEEAAMRRSALSALRGLQAREALPTFEKLLADSDDVVRLSALLALVEMQPEKYFPVAFRFLEDPSAWVRGRVVDVLVRVKEVAAVKPLERS
ncbi:MAG: HEAT repeat domain-containing protein [Acidobacteria bacterium]|nr:HEAT repeat domain-containing protein [Acidobacteriota bacterium]MBI3656075.1 HEAT repeat domain-containing protein [Acidobacteriota bacterium]